MGAPAAPPSTTDDGGSGAPMLGDEAVARAAEAAAGHSTERIIDTSSGRDDGLNKCPRRGGTEIQYSLTAKALVCSYCRHSWNEDIAESGASDSTPRSRSARPHHGLRHRGRARGPHHRDPEVPGSRRGDRPQRRPADAGPRHWCRQTLSINSQIPNGAVPDAVSPFLLTREEAVERIDAFAGKRKTFALGRFTQEFVPENVMGVYIPYLVVDGNMHAVPRGTGEVTTREYTVRRRVGKDNYVTETYYDADVYAVQRAFDLLVDDLTVESASRFDADEDHQATNNILNAVQPYDTENAVTYNSNYLKGFTSERRDLNIQDVDAEVEDKFLAIARAKAAPTISRYDRGVRWKEEGVAVHGTRWVSIYVPVWLYSYADSAKGEGALTHYIAVNGRTGTTMGSVPVSHPKIFAASCAAGTVAAVVGALAGLAYMFF
ncbi:TFIIB-type zinc ribbon-containing protein [Brachybacterium sp. GPGPB12]|uniref:TFIIB-type zinc ribbon-containing protein n=1 Tax=Brachybacterium sp. GPGPB12 TaxID=3023517 RepID=UPI0031344C41